MKFTQFIPMLFSFGFFLVIDLLTFRAIRHLFRNRSAKIRRLAYWLHWGLFVAVIASFSYYFLQPQAQRYDGLRTFFSAFVMAFYTAKLVFCLFVLSEEIIRSLQWGVKRIQGKKKALQTKMEKEDGASKISRADFLYSSGALAASVPFYLMMGGVYKNAYDYKIRRVKLELPNLPAAFRGKTIVQISDVHSGSLSDKDAVYKGIRMIKELKPDLFFFTGDLVNNFAWEARDFVEMFREIKADMGTYSVLGNHDYGLYHTWESEEAKQRNFQDLVNTHKEIGWTLLRNEHEVFSVGGQKLGLIGVENWGHSLRFPKMGDVQRATQSMEQVPAKLLLSHDPSHWDAKVRPENPDISAAFAGHTHGAQFGVENELFKWSPVQYVYPRWAGLYQEGQQQLYVNRGFGFIGYPGRVGILPEITLFELA